jgi:GAF domain-containing protein
MAQAPFEGDEGDEGDRQPAGLLRDLSSHVDTLLALTDLVNEDPEAAVRQITGELRDLTDSRLSAIYVLSDGVLVPLSVCSGGEFLYGLGACTCRLGDHPDAAAVLDAGLPLALRDYGRPSYRRGAAGAGGDDGRYASALLLPLAARGEAIGLVELCDTAPRDYVARRGIAERLAKVAAGAVLLIGERRRLGARERVADELIELGDAVVRAGTLPELVPPIAALLLASVEAVDCEIWRLESGRMTCLAAVGDYGWDEATVSTGFEVADFPWYLVAFEARAAKVFSPDDGPGPAPFASAASRDRGYRSTLSLPLVADGRPLGCVDLHDRRERDFGEALDFARGVSALLAGAFHKAVIVEELEQRAADLRTMLDVREALVTAATLEAALHAVARAAAVALELPVCVVEEYVEEIDSLVTRALYETQPDEDYSELGVPTRLDEQPGDRAILEGGVVVIEQISDRDLNQATRDSMERQGEKTCLNVPLLFRGTPLGIMMLLATDEERQFTDRQIELARALGAQAAVAIHGARLSRAVQRRVESDDLTGLGNAGLVRRRLAREVARARRHRLPLSLVSLELDEFRAYRLDHGRPAADDLLRDVGGLVAALLHPHIDVAGRHGGDKFVIVLPHTPLHDAGGTALGEGGGPHEGGAAALAERLRDRVAGLSTDGRSARAARRVTVSVGVAELGPEMADGDALLAAADAAQALARGSGGDSVQTYAPA